MLEGVSFLGFTAPTQTLDPMVGSNRTIRLTTERRQSDRFRIQRDVRFTLLGKRNSHQEGAGKTVNISSKGILFATDAALLVGSRIEVRISWPAELDNRCRLTLVARGRVVRADRGTIAVHTEQYEFRTAGRVS